MKLFPGRAPPLKAAGFLRSGPLVEVALAVKAAMTWEAADPILTFDDATGRVIDLDLRGSKAEIIARLSQAQASARHAIAVSANR